MPWLENLVIRQGGHNLTLAIAIREESSYINAPSYEARHVSDDPFSVSKILNMRTEITFAVSLFTSSAFAILTEEQYPFRVPLPSDLRSPCPALNAAANHGILPRNGRDIDLETVGAAVLLAYNMTYETMLVVGTPGLTTSTTGNASTFHLSDLAQHTPQAVEHDGSLSRDDAYFGDALSFSWDAWNRTLSSWGDIDIVDVRTFRSIGEE